MSKVATGSKLADWLDNFVNFMSSKVEDNEEVIGEVENKLEVEAEIDPTNLTPFQWNDQTFYADMTTSSEATIYDEGGELITTLQNIDTIDAVKEKLSEVNMAMTKESSDLTDNPEFQIELSKIVAYLNKESEEETIEAEEEIIEAEEIEEIVEAEEVEETNEDVIEASEEEIIEAEEVEEIIEDVAEATDEIKVPQTSDVYNIIMNGLNEMENLINKSQDVEVKEYYKGYIDTARIAFNQLSKFVTQEYARTNPGDVYDNFSQESETQHYNQTALETQQSIQEDNSYDRTTVDGRYTVKNRITERIMAKKENNEIIVASEEVIAADDIKTLQEIKDEYQRNYSALSGKDSVMLYLKDFATAMHEAENVTGPEMSATIISELKKLVTNPPEGFAKIRKTTLARMVNQLLNMKDKDVILSFVYNTILSYEGLGAIGEVEEQKTVQAKDLRKKK